MENQLPNIVLAAVAGGMLMFAGGLTKADETPAAKPQADAPSSSEPAPQATTAAPMKVAPASLPAAAPAPVVKAEPAKPAPAVSVTAKPVPVKPTPPAKPIPVKAAPVKPAPVKPAPTQPLVAGVNPDDAPPTVTRGKASKDPTRPPAYGAEKPKTHVIIFSDFQCPVCRRAKEATHQIAQEFPGEVRLEFWNHALKMHRNAEIAAAAGIAAQQQGKFWEMHDIMFDNQAGLDEVSLTGYAQKLGLDMARFKKDLHDPAIRKRIAEEGEFAKALGARGTPAFLVNGKLSVGWGSWNGFRGTVERELTKAKSSMAGGTSWDKAIEARAQANAKSPEIFNIYLNKVLVPLASTK